MKKTIILAAILLLLPIATAEDWIYNSKDMLLNTTVYSDFNIIKADRSSLSYVTVNLSFFPKDNAYQDVLSIGYFPEPQIGENIFFKWENPTEDHLDFAVNALLRTRKNIGKVTNKVSFPLKDLSEDMKQYTEPSDIIDSDDKQIINLASSLVEGEDDLFVISYKIGKWVEDNVEYDLNTVTLDASQKASWVLENKKGVCDEITNLFIAMMRSLGVPARFVSGISYTNLPNFPTKWGPHGWAEVYFPGYGWIPFDITYGEYGYTDATHIAETISAGAEKLSTQYKWLGKNVDVETKKLKIAVDVQSTNTEPAGDVSLKTDALKSDVGFGSSNLVETNVKNLKDYYVVTLANIAKVENLKIEPQKQHVLLKPNEQKKVYWIITVPSGLDRNYLYTYPVHVYTRDNISSRSSFVSSSQATYYSKEEIENLYAGLKEEEKKTYLEEIELKCDAEKSRYNVNEPIKVSCNVKNKGNVFLRSLMICLDSDCNLFDLAISQEKSFTLTGFSSTPGVNNLQVKVTNKELSKIYYINIVIEDKPELTMKDLEYPKTISFNEIKQISFLLETSSYSEPQDVEIHLVQNRVENVKEVGGVERTERITLNILGKGFSIGENTFKIIVYFEDKDGKEYSIETEEFSITLNKVNFWQRTLIFFGDIGKWFRGMF